MPTKVNREEFLRQLESVAPGLSQRDIIEQSSCFVFKNGEVMAYNDEVACRGPSVLNGEIEGAVKADKLLELLRKLPEDEIKVGRENGAFLISGKYRKAGLRMEEEIALPINNLEQPDKWKKLPLEFTDAISVVQQCASQDQTHFEMTCVHIHPNWVEACDNFQLCRWTMKTGFKKPQLVRQSSIQHIVQLGVTEFAETNGWLHFRNDDGLVLSCRRYEEEYKDFSGILGVKGTVTRLPKQLAEAAEKAAIFSAENGKNDRIRVELKAGKIRLKGEGISGWYEEFKSIKYSGEPMTFLISPSLLAELTKKHEECEVAPGRLKVVGEKYTYVACLVNAEANKVGEPEEEESTPIKSLKRKRNKKREEEEGEEE